MSNKIQLSDCPFCGFVFPDDPDYLMDIVYRTGTVWRKSKYGRTYHSLKDSPGHIDGYCWEVVCNESMGGCGVTMFADSQQETIDKWNTRSTNRYE